MPLIIKLSEEVIQTLSCHIRVFSFFEGNEKLDTQQKVLKDKKVMPHDNKQHTQ